jgi:hypothetical protein
VLEPIGRRDASEPVRASRLRYDDGCTMTTLSNFESVKQGTAAALWRRVGAYLRRYGSFVLRGLHEQRRREAARILAHERYLAGVGGAARLDAVRLDERPKIVPLRRAPATQPSLEPPDAPLDWRQGETL